MPATPDTNDKDRLVSMGEAASLYGYNPDHLRHLAQTGRLKAKKIAGVWLTTPADVEAYIRSRQKRGVYRDDIKID